MANDNNKSIYGTAKYYENEVNKALARAKAINVRLSELLATHGGVESVFLFEIAELMKRTGSLGSSIASNKGKRDEKILDSQLSD
jgi:hypothetical protein